jgi:hypothetical protein
MIQLLAENNTTVSRTSKANSRATMLMATGGVHAGPRVPSCILLEFRNTPECTLTVTPLAKFADLSLSETHRLILQGLIVPSTKLHQLHTSEIRAECQRSDTRVTSW